MNRIEIADIGPDVLGGRRSGATWAVRAAFFMNGTILVSYLIRIPSEKAAHHLTDSELGLIGTAFGVAALIAMQFVGRLVARFGSAAVIRAGLVLFTLALLGLGFAPTTPAFVAAVVLSAISHGALDVSMSAHAVAVERAEGRSIMSSGHAAWSISALIASLAGAAAIRVGMSPQVHFTVVALVVAVVGGPTTAWLLPASADRRARAVHRTLSVRPRRGGHGWSLGIVVIGLMGTVLMLCDGAVAGWSGIFLHDDRGAPLSTAALGYTAYTATQTMGRVVGDRLTDRIGRGRTFRLGAFVAAVGLAAAVSAPSAGMAVAGFAVMGLGGSVLLPLMYSAVGHAGDSTDAGDDAAKIDAATRLSRFTTFTYAGILLGPAVIGGVSRAITLPLAMAALAPLLILLILGGRSIRWSPTS